MGVKGTVAIIDQHLLTTTLSYGIIENYKMQFSNSNMKGVFFLFISGQLKLLFVAISGPS